MVGVVTFSIKKARRYRSSRTNYHIMKKHAHRANRHRISQLLSQGEELVFDEPYLTSWDII